MKILITLSYFLPNISGLTKYVKNLSEEMSAKHDLQIFTSRHMNNLPKEELSRGIKIKRIWSPVKIGRGVVMPSYIFESLNAVKNSDLVNCHLPQFEGIITSIWAKILRKRLIVTYHCDLSFWGGTVNILSTSLVYMSNYISCTLANKIIVNSKDYADNSWFLRIFKNKLEYIYPPVKIVKAKKGVLKKYKDVRYKIGYVGRISKEKGVDILLESIECLKKDLSDFKIFIVGPKKIIGGGSFNKITELVNKYKNNLVFLGKVSEEELSGFYRDIDVLVLPSIERQESFGMVQVEAMLNGCPVIATNLPGVRIPVQKTSMGEIADVADPEDLANKIENTMKKRNVSPASVNNIFSLGKTISDYEKIFES